MSTITHRVGLSRNLTAAEVDANFDSLKADVDANTAAIAAAASALGENIDDRVAALLVAGANVTLTYNDTSNTLTIAAAVSGGVTDGDKGDVVVSGSGAAWTVDAKAISLAKMADMATGSVICRITAGSGSPEVVSFAALKTAMSFVKGDVGLGNVDNTADTAKPVSTAQAAAIALKANADQPVFTGPLTFDGVTVTAAYAMPALAVNTAKGLNTKTISADSAFTFSAAPAADTWFALYLKNSDGAASKVVTFPASFSIAQQVAGVTGCVIPAGGELFLQWRYDGTGYKLWGEMVPGDLAEVALALAATVDLGAAPSYNVTIAAGGTAITSFGTAPAGTYRVGRALGGITVTNSGSIVCLGAVDMVLAAGDIFAARSDGAGNWRILWLSPAAGRPSLTGVNNWAKSQTCDLSAPAYAATITLDRDTHANHINIGTLTGNLTLANPTGYTKAVTLNVWLTQDATGSRLLTLGSKFKTAGGAGITLSTAANAVDLLALTYNPTKDVWFAAIGKAVA